jgi:DNA-binding transcriptional MerR regulator
MSTVAPTQPLRIGDVAKLVGTTPRTIRYSEEIGLLAEASDREGGKHRTYTEADVERLREVIRLKELLGLTLDELKAVVEAEEARATLREEFRRTEDPERARQILGELDGHLDRQLELVRRRRGELERLESELAGKRRKVRDRLRALDRQPV